ncbi:MAG: S26 family signal peptidase [Thermodesulfobacteriota bacterium]|nr:S26 family signal peptidase [Thermodesulfobacteriota bacterium]
MALVVLAALLVGAWLPSRIIVSTSPSLQHRFFFMTPVSTKNIKTGDYLVFKHKETDFVHKGLKEKNDHLIKEVGCSPSELLKNEANRLISCNKKILGKSLERDSTGKPLPQFRFNGLVPRNNFFMIGSDPRSFDSRYFGFVHADNVLYKALPLW